MKKQVISTMTAVALVASVVPAAVADAETSTVKINKVTAVDSKTVQVSYTTKAGKKVVTKVKTTKALKHGATIAQFSLQGVTRTAKLSKAFVNKNYISANNQIAVAKDALNKGADAAAIKAIKNVNTFFSRIKTTEVNATQYKNLSKQVSSLKEKLTDLEAPIVAADFSATEVMEKSLEKMNAVKSMDSVLKMPFNLSLAGEELAMNIKSSVSMFSSPILVKMNMVMDMNLDGVDKVSTQMYMEEVNGKYITYTNAGDGKWLKEETDSVEQGSLNNTQGYMDGLTNVKAIGKQTLQGKELYVVEGTVSGDEMKKALQESGALGVVGTGTDPVTQEMMNELLKDVGDLKMRMWIDSTDYYAVKYVIDMSDLMGKIMSSLMGQMGDLLTKEDQEMIKDMKFEMIMTMVNSNFDGVKAFTIPAEVKNNAVSATTAN